MATRNPTPVIQTESGRVQGEVVDGIHRFLGVPYAEPPFGSNRFLPPVRRQPWDGVLPATGYGPICTQTGGIDFGLPDEGPDCLNLNIWTPDPGNTGLPVMVWAHGGGQVSGAGSNKLYDGTQFAREGVVLVTCNRRLGAEGYLYLEELFPDNVGPGNLGIQDQIAVLRWVQENIKSFGGDPGNVTLFGESGGGAATQAVIATPGADGLLHRAIPQSGGHAAQRPETATAIAQYVLDQLGVKPGDSDSLRAVPTDQIVNLYAALQELDLGQPQVYLPVISEHMPVHPVDAIAAGLGTDIDYLVGTCRDEMNLFAALLPSLEGSIFDQRARKVISAAGANWEAVVRRYREANPDWEPETITKAILGDMWFRVPSLRIADTHVAAGRAQTWMYLFEWESPLIGAAHALDLMVFGNGIPMSVLAGFAEYEKTAQFMRRSWVAFATVGDPSTSQFKWPSYSAGAATVSINESQSVLQDPYSSQREVLGSVLQTNWQSAGL